MNLIEASDEITRIAHNTRLPVDKRFLHLAEEMRKAQIEQMAQHDHYLIWSNEHMAWWGRNSAGYTSDIASAGLYSRAEACKIADQARGGWSPGDPPPEIAVRLADVPEDMRKAVLE